MVHCLQHLVITLPHLKKSQTDSIAACILNVCTTVNNILHTTRALQYYIVTCTCSHNPILPRVSTHTYNNNASILLITQIIISQLCAQTEQLHNNTKPVFFLWFPVA